MNILDILFLIYNVQSVHPFHIMCTLFDGNWLADITLKCYIVLQARIAALTELLPDLGESVRT